MKSYLVFFLNSALLGVGLAIDAFSVSIANGLHEPAMRRGRICAIAGTYAFFQALMPMTGWLLVHTIVTRFRAFQAFVPYIAFGLLAWLGGKMILEALGDSPKGEDRQEILTPWILFIQGIATSIDALSVGFTIADYEAPMALVCSLIIAAVTFLLCVIGLKIGKSAGQVLSRNADFLGGGILIAIGLEILISHLFF